MRKAADAKAKEAIAVAGKALPDMAAAFAHKADEAGNKGFLLLAAADMALDDREGLHPQNRGITSSCEGEGWVGGETQQRGGEAGACGAGGGPRAKRVRTFWGQNNLGN